MCIRKKKKDQPKIQQVKKEPPNKEEKECPKQQHQKSPAVEQQRPKTRPKSCSITQTTPDPEKQQSPNNNNNKKQHVTTTTKTEAKSKNAKPKKPTILPPADENDTVYGYKATISERVFNQDPKSELSEYEKIKMNGK